MQMKYRKYFQISISIDAAICYLYESGTDPSVMMTFYIHEISTALSMYGTCRGITYVNYVWWAGGREVLTRKIIALNPCLYDNMSDCEISFTLQVQQLVLYWLFKLLIIDCCLIVNVSFIPPCVNRSQAPNYFCF